MKTIAVGPMRLNAACIAKNMLEFGQVRFQISSYFGNKQTGRSLFAMSVGMGWGCVGWGGNRTLGAQTEGVTVEMPLR